MRAAASNAPPSLSPLLVLLLAVAMGLVVANLCYVQPLLHAIARAFDVSARTAGVLVTVTLLGYAAGLLFIVPLGDVPFHSALNIWPFAVWQRRFWQKPSRRPQSFFLALDGDYIVGLSELRNVARPDWLGTGLTGVKRSYRRRGIALALKLSAAQHAKDAGFEGISTQNHTLNRAMLSINEALGFEKEPAWIKLERGV